MVNEPLALAHLPEILPFVLTSYCCVSAGDTWILRSDNTPYDQTYRKGVGVG